MSNIIESIKAAYLATYTEQKKQEKAIKAETEKDCAILTRSKL